MKNNYLKQLYMLSKLVFYGFVLQLFFFSFLIASTTDAQIISKMSDVYIDLNDKNMSVGEVFDLIESKTSFEFLYIRQDIHLEKEVKVRKGHRSVKDLLLEISKNTDLSFKQINNNINVRKRVHVNKDEPIEIVIQGRTITGKVTSAEDSEGLPGVNVMVKGTSQGTVTDVEGNYSLEVPDQNSVLVFSSVGYVQEEVMVGDQTVINLSLVPDLTTLDEIIVVGYGTQKKEDLTGAINQVDSKVFEERPIINLSEGLQGVIPNLHITTVDGEPGSSPNYNIRGVASISGNSNPLILVDGVEMDPDLINDADVKSVTALKDAAASAIYGSRAAFGVILIETKSGQKNRKTTVNISSNTSFRTPTILPDVVQSAVQYAELVNQAMLNAGEPVRFQDDVIDKFRAHEDDPINNPAFEVLGGGGIPGADGARFEFYGYTDWAEELIKDRAFIFKNSINASGGNENTSFYASIGYLQQSGLYKHTNDSYERLNTSLKISNQTFPWLTTGFKVGFNTTVRDVPHVYKSDETIFNTIVFSTPTIPVRYPDDGSEFAGRYLRNPVGAQKLAGRDETTRNHTLLNVDLNASIDDYWSVVTNFTANLYRNDKSEYAKRVAFLGKNYEPTFGNTEDDYFVLQNTKRNYYAFNAYTQYQRTFGELYTKSMVGFNQEFTEQNRFEGRRDGMINPESPGLSLGTGQQLVEQSQYELAIRGGFFRVNFIYDDRYLLEFNGRYDGTSRFSTADRFVFSPSVSGAWRISNESFMESLAPVLSELKVRASYGSLANQSLGNVAGQYYPYIPGLESNTSSRFIFDDVRMSYVNAPRLVANSLTWETTTTTNFGLDAGFFDNRLTTSFDIYTRKTTDMLLPYGSSPEALGASPPYVNGADLETKGWELTVDWRQKVNNKFNYSVGINLADNESVITKYDNPNGALFASGRSAGQLGQRYYEGYVLGQIWGYETVGIFQTQEDVNNAADQSHISKKDWEAGDIQYADLNDDGVIDEGDETLENPGDLKIIGNSTPRYTYGITGDVNYGNFSLNVFFQGVGKRDYWPQFQGFWPYASQYFQVQKHFVTDSWSEDNRGAYFSRPYARDDKNRQQQSRFIQDASYIRLKNLTIGYTLPQSVLKKIKISQLKIFLTGQNLWEHSNIKKPLDPEINQNRNNLGYSYQRAYSVGLNITL